MSEPMKQAKVTLNPSEEIIQAAHAEITVLDARHRVIRLKKPGVLAQYRLIELLGESAKNAVYMPASKAQVEALIQQLDEDGIAAVMQGVQEYFGKADPEGDKAALKK